MSKFKLTKAGRAVVGEGSMLWLLLLVSLVASRAV